MHISNIESLKVWLIKHLTPVCEADPHPLAKYILALVKKDKNDDELKSICLDQLDVFLQENTTDFVEKLFQALQDGSYEQCEVPEPEKVRRVSQEHSDRKRKVKKADSPDSPQVKMQRKSERAPSPITMGSEEAQASNQVQQPQLQTKNQSFVTSLTSRSRRERYNNNGPPYQPPQHQQNFYSQPQQQIYPPTFTYAPPHQAPPLPIYNEAPSKPRCAQFDTQGMCLLGASCPYDHGPNPIEVPAAPNYPNFYPPNPMSQGMPVSVQPNTIMTTSLAPSIMSTGSDSQLPNLPMPSHHRNNNNIISLSQGPEQSGPRNNKQNREGSLMLEIRRVPIHQNDPTTLTEHFSKFGTVVDIATNYDNDPEAALITFSQPSEAKAAFKSPEPILQNRFIRIFFHNPQNPQSHLQRSVHDRLGGRKPRRDKFAAEYDKFDSNSDEEDPQAAAHRKFNKAALSWTPDSAAQKLQKVEIDPAQKAEELAQAVLERKAEGEKILEQQRVAMERVKAQRELRVKVIQMLKTCKENQTALANLFSKAKDTHERHKIAETMKPINGQIRDLELQLGLVNAGSPAVRDMQREMLDLELEVYQKDGLEPIVELKKRLSELKKQISLRAPPPPRVPPQKLGPQAAFPAFNQTKLDKRTRSIVISGHEEDQTEDLLRYVNAHFGVRVSSHSALPGGALQLQLASRQEAEVVLGRFRNFNDKPIKCEWTDAKIKEDPPAVEATS